MDAQQILLFIISVIVFSFRQLFIIVIQGRT